MNPIPTFEAITALFPHVTDDAIETYMITLNGVLKVSDPAYLGPTADLVRQAAEVAQDPARCARLLEAAEAIAAGRPCTDKVPEDFAFVPAPVEAVEPEVDEDEELDAEDDYCEGPPPALPHLPVRHFFNDLVIWVAKPFVEALGRTVPAGLVLKLLRTDEEDGVWIIIPLAGPLRSIRLDPEEHGEIIENADNAWFQPVPNPACLRELCYWIGVELKKADDALDEDDDDDYEEAVDRIDELREGIQECVDWLDEQQGKPPNPRSGALASTIFGKDSKGAAWVRLLNAGVKADIVQ